MTWYAYKRGGWEIAVDAMNRPDASQHIKLHAPGAVFQGEFTPSHSYNNMTAMTTACRQEQISANLRREEMEFRP